MDNECCPLASKRKIISRSCLKLLAVDMIQPHSLKQTGLTPLMEAASGGYAEVGRVLLDKGADVNAPPVPSSRDTALTIAADKGHYKFCELLINRYEFPIVFVIVCHLCT